ncbi:hypothetical protein FGG08_001310 [Glutinoglossum americanum]|uniref:EngB-type G domain-containing protein n=1 Tax=Glutinoglossum americanum TaxID=1670608 RepID=A0A9P8IH04_9PEZI|nr:hypothetical protein FGG08_001310 [Glutinoglossum americanum]
MSMRMSSTAKFSVSRYNSSTLGKKCLHEQRSLPWRRILSSQGSPPPSQTSPQPPQPPPRSPPKIPSTTLSLHWPLSQPPTPSQLSHADTFFTTHAPSFLWSAPEFRTMDFHPDRPDQPPEVAFLGRSNVGKSSLLNALLGSRVCNTSSKPGRTRSMNAISVHQGRLVVLDMPGYGKGSHREWGAEILKYLTSRRQLRKTFLLIDSLHGPKPTDTHLLRILQDSRIPHQIVLSKVDRVLLPKGLNRPPPEAALERGFSELRRTMEDVRALVDVRGGWEDRGRRNGWERSDRRKKGEQEESDGWLKAGEEKVREREVQRGGEILSCSTTVSLGGKKLGMSAVRWAVLVAAGLEGGSGGVGGKGRIKTQGINAVGDDRVQDNKETL